jgi:hypothetical protein
MKKKFIVFRTENEKLLDWLHSKPNISSFIESELDKIRTGFYVEKQKLQEEKEIKLENLRLKNEKLRIEIKIKEQTLLSGNIPSIKQSQNVFYGEYYRPTTNEIKPIEARPLPPKQESSYLPIEEIPVALFCTLKNINEEWKLKCDFCHNEFSTVLLDLPGNNL